MNLRSPTSKLIDPKQIFFILFFFGASSKLSSILKYGTVRPFLNLRTTKQVQTVLTVSGSGETAGNLEDEKHNIESVPGL